MANISPKLFQNAIKGLKTTLFTTSTMALMLSSSGALGAARQVVGPAAFDTGAGLDGGGAVPFVTGSTLQYTTNDTVDANLAVNVAAVDINGQAPGLFTVNKNISLGSVGDVAGGGAAFPVTVSDTFTLTLTGTAGAGVAANIYTGLGPITLEGANGALIINSAVPANLTTLAGAVIGNAPGDGILTVTTPTNFSSGIGTGGNYIEEVNLNANSEITGELVAGDIKIGGTSQIKVTDQIDANTLVFQGDAQLTVGNGIATANATNVNPNTGTLIINGGDILNVGNAGAGNPGTFKQVTFNNTAASNAGNLFATDIVVNNGGTNVTTGTVNGAINFAADGKLTANGLIDGAVTAANGNGTLTALAGVTGAVGADGASLKIVNTKVDNGAANLVFGSDVYAQTVNFDDVAGGGAVGVMQVGGDLIATTVNFSANANGGILEFNDATAGAEHDFVGAIANGDNATLNVNTARLTTYDQTIGDIHTINIAAGNKELVIDAGDGDVTLLADAANGQAINFGDANSALAFSNQSNIGKGVAGTVKLAAALLSSGADQNRLAFLGGQALTEVLNVTNNGAAVINVGNGGNTFSKLSIVGVVATNGLNLAGVAELDVLAGAVFLDKSSAVNIATINIGALDATLGVPATGKAVYVIDADGANVNLPGNNIKFAHKDATLILENNSVGANGTITLAQNIDPNADDEGIVVLNSQEAGRKLTIAGNKVLGGAHKLQSIVFTGDGDFDTSAVTLNTTGIDLDTTGALTLGATTANITILDDAVKLTQTGNIGGFLDFNGKNGAVTLNDGVNVVGAVQNTKGTNNGTLIALGASNLGSVNGIAMLKVGAGAVTIGGAGGDIKIGEIQGNGTALLTLPANFKLTGGFNKTGGQALKLSFANGSSVSDVVGTAANPVGDMTLTGATSFANTVNSNGVMTLAKGSVTTFAKDVKATSFVANGATMEFDGNLALNGNITGSGTTLDLGVNQVTYTGTGSFTDALTLETIFDGAAKSGGNVLIKSGSTLDLSGVSSLALNITAINFNINNIDENSQYKVIFAEAAGGLKPASSDKVKVTVNNQNRFVGITFDTSSLTLFAEDIAEEVIDDLFAPGGELANIPEAAAVKRSFELMEQAPDGSDAREVLDNLGDLPLLQAVDAVNRLRQNSVKPSEVVAACGQAVSGNILGNLASINTRIDRTQAAAIAAGDEDLNAQYGGWINPFIGNATQKKIQNISGYKSDTTGGTLGFDALINDDAVLGLAYTRAETDVKMKDAKQGDKNKVRSNIFSIYGLYNLPQSNFFVEGVASYGDSKVTSKSRRIVSVAPGTIGYQTATGKYKSENYTGQLMAGYNYAMPETVSAMPLTVTPMAGIRYSDIKDKGYKETGTTFQNLTVKGKNYNTFDGLAGAKLSSNLNVGEVVLTPELYAMVDYAFKNKAPAIDARLQGMTVPFPTNSFKPKKTSFDLGAGVTIKHNMVEYGVNYDANIGNKYFAQQGSVKVRVNF